MTYHNAIKYIEGAANDSYDNISTERISYLLSALDTPWKRLKYIRVAGSNGKTICSAMLSSILTEAEYKVCTLTMSPTNDPKEAILYGNRPVSVPQFTKLITPIYELAQKIKKAYESAEEGIKRDDIDNSANTDDINRKNFRPELTRGEILLCAALLFYKEMRCDLMIIEAEHNSSDPSLTLPPPFAAVISGAIPENAPEELSKIKPYIQRGTGEVVSAPQNSHAYKAIADTCAIANCRLSLPIRSLLTVKKLSLIGTEFSYGGEDYKLSLCGRFQTINAITVIEAVKLLRRYGYRISTEKEKAGMVSTKLRARFELLSASPTVIADSTYKEEAIDTVCESLFDFSEITGLSLSLCLPPEPSLILNYVKCLSERGYKIQALYSICPDEKSASELTEAISHKIKLVPCLSPRAAAKTIVTDLPDTELLLISGNFSFADSLRLEIMRRLNF